MSQIKQVRSRRRLSTSTRKKISSYYTEEEQQEIEAAAFTKRISISGFVASAALEEARRVNSKIPLSAALKKHK